MQIFNLLILGITTFTLASSTPVGPSPPAGSDIGDDHITCYGPEGLCTKLGAAVASAQGLLNAPLPGSTKPDEESTRSAEYLLAAVNQAAGFKVAKRSPGHSLCYFRSAICMKVKRAAASIEEILSEPLTLTKRDANPHTLCYFRSAICMKAKRSADQLLQIARDFQADEE